MVYNAIGLMSGSSLDGLDIVFTEFNESAGQWNFKIKCAACIEYDDAWVSKLRDAVYLSALDYQLLNVEYGRYLGKMVNEFIEEFNLQHQVSLIASHGHTTFHLPEKRMTHQLGDGATIAAESMLPVVSDLRALDVAFGGQGAPIVPMGEKLLFPECHYFLNIGGIANLSLHKVDEIIAFDICAANRVLNMLANEKNKAYDEEGNIASLGKVVHELLSQLNDLDYYTILPPKSLSNSFGTEIIYPLIKSFSLSNEDALCTYVEHIAIQVKNSFTDHPGTGQQLMITGGGAFNQFLVSRISKHLKEINFEIYVPENEVVVYKEALIMGLLGILRWREQYTTISSVTGASRNSIGGALWLGTEA
ncbi:MAG: anhydro-N-acetylmuramic acid kinase [Ginsengibacter sp.]